MDGQYLTDIIWIMWISLSINISHVYIYRHPYQFTWNTWWCSDTGTCVAYIRSTTRFVRWVRVSYLTTLRETRYTYLDISCLLLKVNLIGSSNYLFQNNNNYIFVIHGTKLTKILKIIWKWLNVRQPYWPEMFCFWLQFGRRNMSSIRW